MYLISFHDNALDLYNILLDDVIEFHKHNFISEIIYFMF